MERKQQLKPPPSREEDGENDSAEIPTNQQAQSHAMKKRSLPSAAQTTTHDLKDTPDTEGATPRDDHPVAKRPKGEGEGDSGSHHESTAAAAAAAASTSYAEQPRPPEVALGGGGETPPMKTPEAEREYDYAMVGTMDGTEEETRSSASAEPKTPVPHVRRSHSSGSVSSDLSSSSASTTQRHDALSPIPPTYVSEVPPAPPSTPASTTSRDVWDFCASSMSIPSGLMTPLPVQPAVLNASRLEQQQLLAEGAATPAPTRPEDAATPAPPRHTMLSEDFSDWAVGDRYEMVRVLGRGSYGEVAQAVDLREGRADAFVAIKRIQSPFDQEVDAIRLYREIHILRQMRGHDCIIQLVDVVQPPTDDLDDFHDLYLVFECK